MLGDGKSMLPVLGIGQIDFLTDSDERIILENVLYVPELKDTLFSIRDHLRFQGCNLVGKDGKIN